MRYGLRTLLIWMAVGPPLLAAYLLHLEAVAVVWIALGMVAIAILAVANLIAVAKRLSRRKRG